MTKPKDKAAQALAAKRWGKTGKRERKRHGAMLAQSRAAARAERAGGRVFAGETIFPGDELEVSGLGMKRVGDVSGEFQHHEGFRCVVRSFDDAVPVTMNVESAGVQEFWRFAENAVSKIEVIARATKPHGELGD